MIEQGKVLKLLPEGKAEIELIQNLGCSSCKICLTPGLACKNTVIAENSSGHKPGDTVAIEIDSSHFYKAFFLVFILPLTVLCFALYFLESWHWPKYLVLIGSLVLFLGSYFFAYRYDRRISRQNLYRILK